MRGGHNPLRTGQRQVASIPAGAVVDRPCLGSTRMNTHAHLDRSRVPCFVLQAALRGERGAECVAGRMEGGTKGVTDDAEDLAIMYFNGLAQNGVMPCEERRQGVGII